MITLVGMDTRERISEVRENPEPIEQLAQAAGQMGQDWLHAADEFIRKNPYVAVGLALAAGVVIASLIRDRD
jgi:ElaB/YqjD/DUF883 family membrane-anchored ribosome-binding protein